MIIFNGSLKCLTPVSLSKNILINAYPSHSPFRQQSKIRYGGSINTIRSFTASSSSLLRTLPATALGLFIFSGKLFIALSLISWFHETVMDICPAVGPSMQPLVDGSGDLLVFERLSYKLAQIRRTLPPRWRWKRRTDMQRGDVVIALSGGREAVKICKRIVAVPGDLIVLPSNGPTEPPRLYKIPPEHVWLQGDNTEDSHDSRHYGAVPKHYVLGRVFCRIWPIWKARWIRRDSLSIGLKQQYIQNIPPEVREQLENSKFEDDVRKME